MLIYAAIALILFALLLLWLGARQRRSTGLPEGRIVYSDTGGWNKVEQPFYDAALGLAGRPDYLVEQAGASIPVEVKSGWAPAVPHESHLFQLAAYCLLVERASGRRPPYGLIAYRNRTFAVDYTPQLEQRLLQILAELRQAERLSSVERSHEEPARCARCGFRQMCDQKL